MSETVLSFATDLYAASAIQRAVEAFDEFATFSVSIGESAITVRISDADAIDLVADEFANFALNESIIAARAPNVTVSP